ncbi:MAG: purine-nucleoside phosphorylase [Actinomycetota bacterium]|jgi:purine-nucleoside phosphorylase|nr:purine-nucleoside phosphorylase [Actinomycetota bacterium]
MTSNPIDISQARMAAVREAADTLRSAAPFEPRVLVILGSGLEDVVEGMEIEGVLPFQDVPGIPAATVPGHMGRFVFGRAGGVPVLAMQGRMHQYEGYTADQVVLPVRAARLMGCTTFVVTNACGGVVPALFPGDLLLITDHMNLMGTNPLIGRNLEDLGTRFPPMATAYTPALQDLARKTAAELGIPLAEGVYAGVLGPSFETPAEVRALRLSGADVVGMSTVPEVIAAVHAGMDVLGFSLVTNVAAGIGHGHEEVLAASAAAAPTLARLVAGILTRL